MKKIAIVVDSSASLDKDNFKNVDVYVAPLTIIHNNTDYQDQITLSQEDVHNLLRNKESVKTSQPNLGILIELFDDIKSKEYDHVFVIALSSYLSGTYQAFLQAQNEIKIDNLTLVDSLTLAGPIHQAIYCIEDLNAKEVSIELMIRSIEAIFDNTESFVYPQTLDQLKLSGRISKTAATLASLLKVKPLLSLANGGTTIEKYGTARTEAKIFELIGERMESLNITADAYDLYLLECDGMETLTKLNDYLTDRFGTFKTHFIVLPAAIATHAGLGTIALQWAPKV